MIDTMTEYTNTINYILHYIIINSCVDGNGLPNFNIINTAYNENSCVDGNCILNYKNLVQFYS